MNGTKRDFDRADQARDTPRTGSDTGIADSTSRIVSMLSSVISINAIAKPTREILARKNPVFGEIAKYGLTVLDHFDYCLGQRMWAMSLRKIRVHDH
jgi:hypothetical protein